MHLQCSRADVRIHGWACRCRLRGYGYCESFNGKLRDELLNGELFYSLKEAQVVIEQWRGHYNMRRSHSSLGYRAAGTCCVPPNTAGGTTTEHHPINFNLSHKLDRNIGHANRPRFVTGDMIAIRNASVGGVGVAHLSVMMVTKQLADGSLARLLPQWAPRPEILHAVFPSRRGCCRRSGCLWIIWRRHLSRWSRSSRQDSGLVMRVLGESRQRLVVCPAFLKDRALPRHPSNLADTASLG